MGDGGGVKGDGLKGRFPCRQELIRHHPAAPHVSLFAVVAVDHLRPGAHTARCFHTLQTMFFFFFFFHTRVFNYTHHPFIPPVESARSSVFLSFVTPPYYSSEYTWRRRMQTDYAGGAYNPRLGSHVARGAAASRQPLARLDEPRQAEVGGFQRRRLVLALEQKVIGFDVAEDDSAAVALRGGAQHRPHQIRGGGLRVFIPGLMRPNNSPPLHSSISKCTYVASRSPRPIHTRAHCHHPPLHTPVELNRCLRKKKKKKKKEKAALADTSEAA